MCSGFDADDSSGTERVRAVGHEANWQSTIAGAVGHHSSAPTRCLKRPRTAVTRLPSFCSDNDPLTHIISPNVNE